MSGDPTLRICSLVPSATEAVAALGQLDRLVGRSAECDFPPSVSSLPVVSYGTLAGNGDRERAEDRRRRPARGVRRLVEALSDRPEIAELQARGIQFVQLDVEWSLRNEQTIRRLRPEIERILYKR